MHMAYFGLGMCGWSGWGCSLSPLQLPGNLCDHGRLTNSYQSQPTFFTYDICYACLFLCLKKIFLKFFKVFLISDCFNILILKIKF